MRFSFDDESPFSFLSDKWIEAGQAQTEVCRDLFLYIEGFYNSRHLTLPLGYVILAQAGRIAAYPSIF